MNGPVDVGPISAPEVEAAVRIFLDAFYDNVREIYGEDPKPDAMLDVWTFAREAEPGGFVAARNGSGLLGYAIFTSSLRDLQRRAVLSGRIILWTLRALAGRYGVRWMNVGTLLWNKALYVGSARRFRTEGDAQLLNIAVNASARGRGVAKALIGAGLRYLAERRVPEVRLEVRPDNASAIAVYRDAGFVEKGRMRNIHGDWLVMTARP